MKCPVLSIALLGVALAPACQVTDVHAVPSRTWTTLGGRIAATDLDAPGSLRGSSLDDLGIGGRESNDFLSLQWTAGGDRWELFGHSTDSTGTGDLADDVTLDGVTLDFHDGEVDTEVHLGVYGLRWVRPLTQRGPIEVGCGVSLVVAEFDLDMDQDATGKSIGDDALMPFPLPVVDFSLHREAFDARLSLAGMWVWVEEGDGHMIDVDFHVRTPLFDDIGELVCGYHTLELELEHSSGGESARLDVAFSGPYLGLRFGF